MGAGTRGVGRAGTQGTARGTTPNDAREKGRRVPCIRKRGPMSLKPGRPVAGIRLSKLEQARNYILANPTLSKSQIMITTGLSDTTIARARAELINEGLIQSPRNRPTQSAAPPSTPGAPSSTEDSAVETGQHPAPAPKPKGLGLLDHSALLALEAMIETAVDSGDDITIQKKLIKQCLMFALRPDLHPDTRMSASTMWGKLRDMAKAKDLGPGKPMTLAMGDQRLADMMLACGPEMTMRAVNIAFTVKGAPDEGQLPADATEAPPSAPGPAESPGNDTGVQEPR